MGPVPAKNSLAGLQVPLVEPADSLVRCSEMDLHQLAKSALECLFMNVFVFRRFTINGLVGFIGHQVYTPRSLNKCEYVMWAWAALVGAMALWSTSFIAAKWALIDLSPEQAVGLRLWVATALTLPAALLLARRQLERLTREDWKLLCLVAIFEPCLYFLAEMHALLYTSASAAGLVTSTLPLWIAISAWWFLGERLKPRVAVAIGISMLGALGLTLVTETSGHASNPLLGNGLMLLAMIFGTGYVLIAKRLTKRINPWIITLTQAWIGALFFTPWMLFDPPELAAVSSKSWLAVLWLGSIVTLGAYGLYNVGISKVSAQTAGMAVNLLPIFTMLLAASLLHERLSAPELAAGACILVGVVLAAWPSQPRRALEQAA